MRKPVAVYTGSGQGRQAGYTGEAVDTSGMRRVRRLRYDNILLVMAVALGIALVVLSLQRLSAEAEEFVSMSDSVITEQQASELLDAHTPDLGIYNELVPMPREHQEYLYELCELYGLDYIKTLAVIQHESLFDANATNATNDFGYFQINEVNHASLAEKLKTKNQPFDPYVNMQWGTYMLSDLYAYWEERGYHGQGLDDAVWSSYNKGVTGFLQYGHAVEYINRMKASIEKMESKF